MAAGVAITSFACFLFALQLVHVPNYLTDEMPMKKASHTGG